MDAGIFDQLVEASLTTIVTTLGIKRSTTLVQQLGTHYLTVLRTQIFRYLLLHVIPRFSTSLSSSYYSTLSAFEVLHAISSYYY